MAIVRGQLGRRSLELDALYCAGAGALLIGLRRPVGRWLGIRPGFARVGGAATLAWAAWLAGVSRRRDPRPLVIVGTVNAVAAAALIGAGVRHPRAAGRFMLLGAGVEVATFAIAQAAALALPEQQSEPAPGTTA